jgi:two-component system sensor histidine kinase/response regulator
MKAPTHDAPTASILLVDDRRDKLLALESLLAPLGQRVVKAQSGEEALRRVLQEEYAVILLDVAMPGMDGFETASLIRQRESARALPILFVTALESNDERLRRAYQLGAVDYLPGAASSDALLSKVKVLVDLYAKTKRLETATRELEEKNQQLENICYAVAHDLRSPLRSLQGFSQALLAEEAERLGERGKEYLQRISASTRRMDTLTADLLLFAKYQHDNLLPLPVDVGEVANEAIEFLGDEINRADAEVSIRQPLCEVRANKEALTRVVTNLVANAITYVAEGRRPKVEIYCRKEGSMVRISVRDNGIGIAPENMGRLFRMFERLSSSREIHGTGLGLAIVKTGIERMGGSVGVESMLGTGSTFWVKLPSAERIAAAA